MTPLFRFYFALFIFKRSSGVWCTSISGFSGDLIIDEIAPYLPTVDLHFLSRTSSSMKDILSHLLVRRYIATAEKWLERNAISLKYCVTNIEIAHIIEKWEKNTSCNGSNLNYNFLRDGPSHELRQRYLTRYELSHQDYYPVDVESIRWLTGQSSTLQFLSLDRTETDTLSPSSVYFNDTIKFLEALRYAIRYGQRTFGDRQLKDVPMIAQMNWVDAFETPNEIMHHWFVINRFLHDIQDIVPEEDYEENGEWVDKWFTVVHSFWDNLLKEVNKHFFFRHFRRIEDIPRFQHSVRWTMLFFMFQTAGDPQEIVKFKGSIISNPIFRKGIRDFIEAVEIALDDIKPVVFDPVNVSSADILNDEEMLKMMTLILDVMNHDSPFQRWWWESFIDSLDHWRSILFDVQDGNVEDYQTKEILAASILWDLEALIAHIEPTLFGKHHLHQVLLSLRNRIRRHIFHFILKESWF